MDTDSSPLPPWSFLDIEQCFFAFSCRSAFRRADGLENFLLGHPNADLANLPWLNMPWSACTTKKNKKKHNRQDLLHLCSRALVWWPVKSNSFTLPHAESQRRFVNMSTVQEIKAAIPKLTPQEQLELKKWLEEFFEDQLELNDEVKSKLDQARQEIREGKYRTRQPQ